MADRDLVVHALRELVDALDRRVAHVERLGEARIGLEAAALRKEAVKSNLRTDGYTVRSRHA